MFVLEIALGCLKECLDPDPQTKNMWAKPVFHGPTVPTTLCVKTNQGDSLTFYPYSLSSPYPFCSQPFRRLHSSLSRHHRSICRHCVQLPEPRSPPSRCGPHTGSPAHPSESVLPSATLCYRKQRILRENLPKIGNGLFSAIFTCRK
jgi:hypothetical protein